MRIKITNEYHNDLIKHLKTVIFFKNIGMVCYINDFEVEEVEEVKKHWFKSDEIVKVKYLTSLDLVGYNEKKKFVGTVSEDLIQADFVWRDLYKLRQDWNIFKEQLGALGLKVEKINTEEE